MKRSAAEIINNQVSWCSLNLSVCDLKIVTESHKPTQNYQSTLQFSALRSLFSFFQLIVLVFRSTFLLFWFTAFISLVSSKSRFQQKKADKPTVHYPSNTKQQAKLAAS